MNRDMLPAAYQGVDWQPRTGTLAEDVAGGKFWTKSLVHSEWEQLREVVLFIPSPDTPVVEDANKIQHLEPINYSRLHRQLTSLAESYMRLGVKVHLVKPDTEFDGKLTPHYNLMFARDLFFMSNEGAIISRMASVVRAGEERHMTKTLAQLGIPILRTIAGSGTFEGADAVWLSRNRVAVGIGNRTNDEGFQQVQQSLALQAVECIKVDLPKDIQHLLGIVQIIDSDLAVIRSGLAPKSLEHLLRDLGFKLIEISEGPSVRREAMNFVTISPSTIIMIAGAADVKQVLQRNGVEVAAEIKADELIKGAGGLSCATGILNRDPC